MSTFLNPPFIIAILLSLSVHEWAHGWMAARLGDPTAYNAGRLTLNPLAHLDPIGALMFLFVGFGWAKPVPVNPYYFHHPKRDTTLVALAGPVSNLLLAFLSFFALLLLVPRSITDSPMGILTVGQNGSVLQTLLLQLLGGLLFINLGLMAFNLLPIAPLDGSKILRMFIPIQHEETYENFMQRGPMVLLILILLGTFFHVPLLSMWVFGIMRPILSLMTVIAAAV
ncbi:MAG: site-2 protease family protein [Candidatus Peribacteraceae bacterium]|nr:site-2 protease family protein [Candidatus Peribacteraceae bacterium]